ncbi:uncharacterized protein BXZ73DRAFT_20405, partial [Epithele typhae]|uniref:uncharacterized protein n=1 Tax=Epithele typhae TaxID=378194 RepID=UPI0020079D20
IAYLHSRHVVHLDLSDSNMVWAPETNTFFGKEVKAEYPYPIDFEFSQRLELGPGVQPAIELPPSAIKKPRGITHLDPYSWDVYCLGWLLQWTISKSQSRYLHHTPPWLLRRYVQWIIGEERGCAGVCRCRPTARQAHQ